MFKYMKTLKKNGMRKILYCRYSNKNSVTDVKHMKTSYSSDNRPSK